ncbi:alcohol dehydrogenase [Cryobacterium lactosi]|uniref:alcohol dehydrogenase n=2 Tax=Cryobacterium lactosi TaxID=1259202 RepID=A0A4R9BGZ9_9MICO|nr:alcohol dehydrogenase [Cryobacterium lactosi]
MLWRAPELPHEPAPVSRVRLQALEVLVEIELATICGSDVHTSRGRRAASTPLILGHEQLGRIVAVGSGAPRAADGALLAIGDRILWSIAASCGVCDRCAVGLTQKCRGLRKYGHERFQDEWSLSGGFATHAHLLAGTPIVRLPETVPAAVLAPVSCGTATAWAALAAAERMHRSVAATAFVSGAGLIGLTLTAMASDRGIRVVVADPDPTRRQLALRFGAAASYNPLAGPAERQRAVDAAGAEDGFDVVVEASGAREAVAGAVAAAAVGGVIVLVGSVFPTEPVPVDAEQIVRRLITVTGVHNYTADDLVNATAYILERWSSHPFTELVGDTVVLADLDEGIRRSGPGGPVRVAVDPRR